MTKQMGEFRAHPSSPSSGTNPDLSKSLPQVPSKRHKHEWVMIDKYDGSPKYKPLPEGRWISRGGLFGCTTYIPGFDHQMLMEHIIDTITRSDQPYYTSQTWTCHCGKTKTNTQEHLGFTQLMTKVTTVASPDSKPSKTRQNTLKPPTKENTACVKN